MLGNCSMSACAALGALALHATIISSTHNVAAEDASIVLVNNANRDRYDRSRRGGKHNLRSRPSESGTKSHNNELTSQQQRELTTCQWHPDITTNAGCTNNPNIDSAWNDPQIKSFMFHSTSEECCKAFFPGKEHECKVFVLRVNVQGVRMFQ